MVVSYKATRLLVLHYYWNFKITLTTGMLWYEIFMCREIQVFINSLCKGPKNGFQNQ